VTWAIVGHLMLDACSKKDGLFHPEIVRSPILPDNEDWFSVDPGSSLERNQGWYGTDLLSIIRSMPYQEIGSHSFSHVNFGNKLFSAESARSEIREARRVAKMRGVSLHSFVFPYNAIAYLGILQKEGFSTFRGNGNRWYTVFPKVFEKSLMMIDFLLPLPAPTYFPKKSSGLVDIPSSFYYFSQRGIRRFIPRGFRYRKAKLGIKQAIKNGSVFHMWFHPVDLLSDNPSHMQEFEELIEYAGREVKARNISSKTMYEISRDAH
jgi:peptidoglycan/xylan/chitin deacetylase (PgdA/CDA1 family)